MEYQEFIFEVFLKIKKERENQLGCKIHDILISLQGKIQNSYIDIVAVKNQKQIKIQEWSFMPLKNLVESEYEEGEDDPQLDSVQVQKKSFKTLLEETLAQFSPKNLMKVIQPDEILMILKIETRTLTSFSQNSNYIVEVCEYEGNSYQTKVFLKIANDENSLSSQKLAGISSQEQFELLTDPQLEKQKQTKVKDYQIIRQIYSPLKPPPKQEQPVPNNEEKPIQNEGNKQSIENCHPPFINTSTKYVYVSNSFQNESLVECIEKQLQQLQLESMTVRQLLEN